MEQRGSSAINRVNTSGLKSMPPLNSSFRSAWAIAIAPQLVGPEQRHGATGDNEKDGAPRADEGEPPARARDDRNDSKCDVPVGRFHIENYTSVRARGPSASWSRSRRFGSTSPHSGRVSVIRKKR